MRFIAMIVMTVRRLARSRLFFVAIGGATLTVLQFGGMLYAMQRLHQKGELQQAGDLMTAFFVNALGILNVFSSLIALFAASFVIRRDLSDATAASVLSKPVSRGEYVAANALGGVVFLAAVWVLFGVVTALAALLVGSPLGAEHVAAMAGRYLSALPLFALGLLFSFWMNAWVGGFLALLVVQTPGIIRGVFAFLDDRGVDVPAAVPDALVWPFPLRGTLDGLTDRLHTSALGGESIWWGIAHVLDYSAVMVILAWLVFRRLEVNRMRD